MLLRLRYRFVSQAGGGLLVRGTIALRVCDQGGLTLVSDSDVADVLLRRLRGEL